MSEAMQCDVCGTAARRRLGNVSPLGGYCAEPVIYGEIGGAFKAVFWVCSDACRDAFWKPGGACLHNVTRVASNGRVTCVREGCQHSGNYCEAAPNNLCDLDPNDICVYCKGA